jgi:hypothetical protein
MDGHSLIAADASRQAPSLSDRMWAGRGDTLARPRTAAVRVESAQRVKRLGSAYQQHKRIKQVTPL